MKSALHSAQRIVIKVGSAIVTNDGRGLDHAALAKWSYQIAQLMALGKEVILVSSGAVAEGMQRLADAGRSSSGGILSTHPGTDDRIRLVREKMPQVAVNSDFLRVRTNRFLSAMRK